MINTTMNERINAARIMSNKTFEEVANAMNVPVYVVKVWCGKRLTFTEWLKF